MASGTCKRNVLGQQKLQNKAADVECDGIGRNGRENKRRCGHGSRFRVRLQRVRQGRAVQVNKAEMIGN